MTEEESKQQAQRVSKFNALTTQRREVSSSLALVREPWEDGPSGQGPFTGNTRESRRVDFLSINFSATRGGSHAVKMNIGGLHIEAYELGRFLESALSAKLQEIDKEIEAL